MVVIIVKIFNEFLPELLYRFKLLQIKQFTLEQSEEVLYHSIIQTVYFSAHTLMDSFLLEHPLLLRPPRSIAKPAAPLVK